MYGNYLFYKPHVQNKGKSAFVHNQVTIFFVRDIDKALFFLYAHST